MPWVKIGRYRFDLDDVALVTDVVGESDGDRHGNGITVTLNDRLTFDLIEEDADLFTQVFDQHVASRTIGKPSQVLVEGRVVYPSAALHPGNAER